MSLNFKKIALLFSVVGCFLVNFVHASSASSSSSTSSDLAADDKKVIRHCFTPLKQLILFKEFNSSAQEIYDYISQGKAASGHDAIIKFEITQTITKDISDYKNTSDYIKQAKSVLNNMSAFYSKLDQIGAQDTHPNVSVLISERKDLIRAVGHCIFDFDNQDDSLLLRGVNYSLKRLNYLPFMNFFGQQPPKPMVTEITVGENGIVYSLDQKIRKEHEYYHTHMTFRRICGETNSFLSDLLKLEHIKKKLIETGRLKVIDPSKEASTATNSLSAPAASSAPLATLAVSITPTSASLKSTSTTHISSDDSKRSTNTVNTAKTDQ